MTVSHMSVSRLIYHASTQQPYPHGGYVCHICGFPTDTGTPVRDIIKDGFTAIDVLQGTQSDIVCPACVYTKEQPSVRTQHYVVTPHSWRYLKREEIGSVLLEPPEPPFAIVIQVSHKKHTWLQAKVNGSRERFWVSLEESPVLLDRRQFIQAYSTVENLYQMGFSKEEIRSGRYAYNRIERVGLTQWSDMEKSVKPLRGSMLLELAIICVNKNENETTQEERPDARPNNAVPRVSRTSADNADGRTSARRKSAQATIEF